MSWWLNWALSTEEDKDVVEEFKSFWTTSSGRF